MDTRKYPTAKSQAELSATRAVNPSGCNINSLSQNVVPHTVRVFLAHEPIHDCRPESSRGNLGPLRTKPGARVVPVLHGRLRAGCESRASTGLDHGVLPPGFASRLASSRHGVAPRWRSTALCGWRWAAGRGGRAVMGPWSRSMSS